MAADSNLHARSGCVRETGHGGGMNRLARRLEELEACEPAIAWVHAEGITSWAEAWERCPRGDWLGWVLIEEGVEGRELAIGFGRQFFYEAFVKAHIEAKSTTWGTFDEAVASARAAYADAIRAAYPDGCPIPEVGA